MPAVVTSVDPANADARHRWPHFLPDGRHFIYTEVFGRPRLPVRSRRPSKLARSSPSEADVTLLQAESSAAYASGHVLFARDETLMAQPFDPETRQFAGGAFPVAERVSQEASRYVGASVSENGTLVYGSDDSLAVTELTWRDRTGRDLGSVGGPAPYLNLALSPEERRVAVAVGTGEPGERRHLDRRHRPQRALASDRRSRCPRHARVVAGWHASRLLEQPIGEAVVACETGGRHESR